jgi:hypothetical protein
MTKTEIKMVVYVLSNIEEVEEISKTTAIRIGTKTTSMMEFDISSFKSCIWLKSDSPGLLRKLSVKGALLLFS